MMKKFSVLLIAGLLTACGSAAPPGSDQFQVQTYAGVLQSSASSPALSKGYLIGPLDKINIRVFGHEDLSADKIQVDGSGQIVLPLIGAVQAGGKTADALSVEIGARLSERYLRSASVSVFIEEAVSQQVTVTGAVVESGVYPLKGPTTLLQAISMAKGADSKLANLRQVAIVREIDGRRARAVFDVAAIRSGEAADPTVYGGDTVIVAESRGQRAWREIVGVLPGLGVFAYY